MMAGSTERIREALHFISPSDRDTWVKMGMAVKSELGDDGFDVWESWSQQDNSFEARAARDVWKGISSNGKVTIGTLIHEAKANGWADNGTSAKPTPKQLAERRRVMAEKTAQEEVRIATDRATASRKASELWKAAAPAKADHPYLLRKRCKPVATLREIDAGAAATILGYQPKCDGELLAGGLLIAPVKIGDALSTVEMIDDRGRKSALYGGAKAGGYWATESLPDSDGAGFIFLIGEGVATTLTAKEANSRYIGIAALSAGNLQAVAHALRKRYPAATIVMLAEIVKSTGELDRHAIEAAQSVGGKLAIPTFGENRPESASDFNDMQAHCGIDAVKFAIEGAIAATARPIPQTVEINAANDDVGGWPDPKPIHAALKPVPKFNPDVLLPEALSDWVMDEADRMPCPPDFIAAAAIVALGSIIGASCAIRPKLRDDWLIVPNLWGGIVGLPSAKKSPAIGAALKPVDRLAAKAIEAHQSELESFATFQMVHEAKLAAIEGDIKTAAKTKKSSNGSNGSTLDELAQNFGSLQKQAPDAPTLRRFKSNDTTVEKLGELLRENPKGLLVMRDELVGLIASWDREGREGERAFYLEAWNGNASFDTDRIGRGSIFIPNLCASIFGGIQPDKLVGYLEQASNALANDGMLQRFQILVYPDHQDWEWRDRLPAKEARDRAMKVFETLAEFDPVSWGASPADDFAKFPHFRFDEEAQEVFIEWSAELHRVRIPAEDQPIMAQHLAKFDKLFPAMALILHLVDCASTGRRGAVTKEAALRAAALCDYLEAHARRCYGLLMDDGLRAAQALTEKLRQGKLADGFTARDVRRNQWRSLTADESVQAALDWLEDEDWLRATEVGGAGPGTGRHTYRYLINPKVGKVEKPDGQHD